MAFTGKTIAILVIVLFFLFLILPAILMLVLWASGVFKDEGCCKARVETSPGKTSTYCLPNTKLKDCDVDKMNSSACGQAQGKTIDYVEWDKGSCTGCAENCKSNY